jgi:hypothetical protein
MRQEGMMNDGLTVLNVMDRLMQKARQIAPRTTTDRERFEALRYFAQDIRNWLNLLPIHEQREVLQRIEQYLKTGAAPGVMTPLDPQEAECFTQLLALIYNPPPVL